MAQLTVPVFYNIRRYLTENILTLLFLRFHNQIFLNSNSLFNGRQKVLLSVTTLATRRSFTGFAGKLPSSLLHELAIWSSIFPCDAQKQLQILQNNTIRTIVGMRKYDHVISSYKNLMILKIHDICKLEIPDSSF